MSNDGSVSGREYEQEFEKITQSRRNLRWVVTLSYLSAALLITALIYFGEPWGIAANTRFLDLMVRGGIVRFTDIHRGFIEGIPDFRYYIWSQEPIHWHLVLVVVVIYFAHWGLRAVQFHSIARFFGLSGSLGQHARAYYYGLGMNHLFPFKFGHVATAAALEGEGESPKVVSTAAQVQDAFVLFEIVVFSLLGLLLTGWRLWLVEITWPLMILLVLYLFVRQTQPVGGGVAGLGTWQDKMAALRAMAEEPGTLGKIAVLGLLAFPLLHVTPFLMGHAFTTDNVILLAPFLVIQSAVVNGYIASRIPLAPGGIGQYELAFAITLYVANVGMPEAVAIILLDGLVRYGTVFFLFGVVRLGYNVRASLASTIALFTGMPRPIPVSEDGRIAAAEPTPAGLRK